MTKTRITKPTEDISSSVGFKKNLENKTMEKIGKTTARKQILWWLQEREGAVFVRFVNKVMS